MRKLESFLLLHADKLASKDLFCLLANIVTLYKKNGVKFNREGDFISITWNKSKYLAFGNRQSFQRYRNGLEARCKKLSDEYLLHRVPFGPGDVVIDIGANFGDFAQIFNYKEFKVQIFCFEPDPVCYEALIRNHPNRFIEKIALSDGSGMRRFVCATETSDSSLSEESQTSESNITWVHTMKLDDYEPLSQYAKIKLLKVETEGFEWEVLKGSAVTLEKVEYVVCDAGPERGSEKRTTVVEVSNYLLSKGFKFIAFYHRRSIVLFRNSRMLDAQSDV